MTAPTLETDRLRLRAFAPRDAEALARLYVNPEVMRYLPGYPTGLDACLARARDDIAAYNAHWDQRGYGVWAVEDRSEQRLIGRCGLRWLDQFSAVELLYMFDQTHWRRGIASEAAERATRFGLEQRGMDRLIGLTLPDNIGSRRVLEKAGFSYQRHTQFRSYTVVMLERRH